jgi:hypothetical protein
MLPSHGLWMDAVFLELLDKRDKWDDLSSWDVWTFVPGHTDNDVCNEILDKNARIGNCRRPDARPRQMGSSSGDGVNGGWVKGAGGGGGIPFPSLLGGLEGCLRSDSEKSQTLANTYTHSPL